MKPPVPSHRSKGVVSVVAVILLAVLGALAVSFAAETSLNLRKANNDLQIRAARLQAESGMAFYAHQLRQASVSHGATPQEMLDALASELQSRLDGTDNLGDEVVAYDGTTIAVPYIAANGRGGGFSATLDLNGEGRLRVTVVGQDLGQTRSVRMCFDSGGGAGTFDYGVMSRGWVDMTGNAKIQMTSDPKEGSVLAATSSHSEAVKLNGNCRIDGDVYTSDADTYVSYSGNVSIGGATRWSGDIDDHIHVGIGPVSIPEADPTVFEPFATNIVDSSTQTSGNRTFTNIRILANTNPTFAGNIKLYGVIFVETPNRVTFSGNLQLTGVVVTQDAGDDALDDNYIHFTGNSNTQGVEYLEGAEFEALRNLPGTCLLAPGFSVKLTGNFGTVNGTIGADEFKFAGNAGGTVHGALINWSDSEMKLVGNSSLTFDLSAYDEVPPGFVFSTGLSAIPGTYEEL